METDSKQVLILQKFRDMDYRFFIFRNIKLLVTNTFYLFIYLFTYLFIYFAVAVYSQLISIKILIVPFQ